MAFISSPEKFIRYIEKTINESPGINKSNLLENDAYISFVYEKKLHNQFTWDLRSNPELLEEENLLNWLQKYNINGLFGIPSINEHIFTAEFSALVGELNQVSGVYSFWSEGGTALYVGVSNDLQSRVASSFYERFKNFKKQIYFKYIATRTCSDAALLEVYFICVLKPALNGASKYSDNLTIGLNNIPSFSDPILCNRIKLKEAANE